MGEFYERVRQEVEDTIRKEVEAEMWEQFEQIYHQGIIKQSDSVVIPIV